MNSGSSAQRARPEWWALGVLLVFTLAAVAGFGNFALHPERLPANSFAIAIFSRSFPLFGRVHIALTIAVLAIALLRFSGWRWVGSALLVFVLSFTSEHLGTGYGIPFGAYSYSELLGFKLGGRVPLLIPLSWFVMSAPAFGLAARVFPGRDGRAGRIVGATLLLVSWDLALDPAMSFLTQYWMWGEEGLFYGMPLVNLIGWFVTGIVLMVAMEFSGAESWTSRVSATWWAAFYGVVLLMPMGMVIAGGLWGSVAATLGALGLLGSLARQRRARSDLVGSPGRRHARPPAGPEAGLTTLGGGR